MFVSFIFTELKNVDKAEVERVAGNLKKDMDAIDADLDNLLSEGSYVITWQYMYSC